MKVAINNTRVLGDAMIRAGYADISVGELKKTYPFHFVFPERLAVACWTMWKIAASGQMRGSWSYTSRWGDGCIIFYFQHETDFAYARLIAGDDDRPEDGWVPEEMILAVSQ